MPTSPGLRFGVCLALCPLAPAGFWVWRFRCILNNQSPLRLPPATPDIQGFIDTLIKTKVAVLERCQLFRMIMIDALVSLLFWHAMVLYDPLVIV